MPKVRETRRAELDEWLASLMSVRKPHRVEQAREGSKMMKGRVPMKGDTRQEGDRRRR
jgi:hypothetical protein